MRGLTSDQRKALYVQAAARSGIHKAILAALYQVQARPSLLDGETGLGIAPANQMALEQVDTFAAQVQYAANTIRSLIDRLIAHGWTSEKLWDAEQGRYTDAVVQAIAVGYTAPSHDTTAALLEASDPAALLQAYMANVTADAQAIPLPHSLAYLDAALLAFLQPIPRCYFGLPYQREALLELVRLWHQRDTRAAAIVSLLSDHNIPDLDSSDDTLDAALRSVVPLFVTRYEGYPYQREALLRLTQLWQQLASREQAIAALAQPITPTPALSSIDAALMAIVLRLPQLYEGKGDQRHALVETFRLWHQLESRSAALMALGVDPSIFTTAAPDQTAITHAARQLDHALLAFSQRLPTVYTGTTSQRDALLHLTQLWRSLHTPEQALHSLFHDLRHMAVARRATVEAPPVPVPRLMPNRPDRWTPDTLQLDAAIIPNGSFTWSEATSGGTQKPTHQATVEAIVHLAQQVQPIRDRLQRPLHVVHWYSTPTASAHVAEAVSSRHRLGEGLTFYCDGLTGAQLYWFLDPWWTGGLARYTQFLTLCYVDTSRDRIRWIQ